MADTGIKVVTGEIDTGEGDRDSGIPELFGDPGEPGVLDFPVLSSALGCSNMLNVVDDSDADVAGIPAAPSFAAVAPPAIAMSNKLVIVLSGN